MRISIAMLSDIDAEIESCEWELLGMDMSGLNTDPRVADKKRVDANQVRWALKAERFWESVVECMRRMFFAEGIEFWSELSATCTSLNLTMRRKTGHVVTMGSMMTYLVDGLLPKMAIRFEFSCLDDVIDIWKDGFRDLRGHNRMVNILPDLSRRDEWRPYGANLNHKITWDGKVTMSQTPSTGGDAEGFCYNSIPLSTPGFIDCMFKGRGDRRMRWISDDPENYRLGPTRHGADKHADVFKVSGVLDPDFSGSQRF